MCEHMRYGHQSDEMTIGPGFGRQRFGSEGRLLADPRCMFEIRLTRLRGNLLRFLLLDQLQHSDAYELASTHAMARSKAIDSLG